MRILIASLFLLLLAACVTVPEQLQGQYPDISPARVDPAVFGTRVRWGGVIVDTYNDKHSTCFEILSRPLGDYMRPKLDDTTGGRFIACKPGFYDPQVFSKGREVTVTGTIRSITVKKIDEFDYRYPMVDADQVVLWEPRKDVIVYHDYYDPFYYPYFWGGPGWGYYPYYYGGYYGRRSGYATTRKTLPDPAEVTPPEKP